MPLKIALILCAALALAGCNTIQGLGRDVSLTGNAIEDTAQDTERGL